MGRVLRVVSFLAVFPGIAAAQGHVGTAASSAGVHGGSVSSGAIHAGGAAGGRAVGTGPGLSANHHVYTRSASGQLVLRRATPMTSRGRASSSGSRLGTSTARRHSAFSEFSDDGAVPGLGFDYSHIAATRPNDVHGRRRNNTDGAALFPFYGGGGYFLPTGVDPGVDPGEGQIVEDEGNADDPGPAARPSRGRSLDRLASVDYGPPAPQPDVPEYVFVRRDGTVFFAVAYSWEQGSLKYVSSEGLRRSVSRDSLDLDATQQFNEQRGMTFRAPA